MKWLSTLIYGKSTCVLIVSIDCILTYYNTKTGFKTYYHLYETAKGRRWCNTIQTTETHDKNFTRTTRVYLTKIKPWLDGCADSDIPTYSEVKANEFTHSLGAKVSVKVLEL